MEATKKEEVKEELEASPDLKCMPFIATEIIRLIDDPQTSSRELRSLISSDASLTGRMLRLVNSAQFAMTRKVSNLSEAIALLGFSQVREAVLLASTEVMRSIPAAVELFKYNLKLASIAKQLCKKANDHELADSAFVAGLLQGIGKCFYLERYENDYAPMLVKQPKDLVKEEIAVYGYPNYKVSYELMKSWDLSDDLAAAAYNVQNPPHKHSKPIEVALFYAAKLAYFKEDDGLSSDFLLGLEREPLEKVSTTVNELRDIFKEGYETFNTTMETFDSILS